MFVILLKTKAILCIYTSLRTYPITIIVTRHTFNFQIRMENYKHEFNRSLTIKILIQKIISENNNKSQIEK